MIGCKFKLQWTTRKFPVKFIVDIGMKKKYTLVSGKSIECNAKQLELRSGIVVFRNVNGHWRAHLERLFGEVTWRGLLESMHVEPPTDPRRTPVWPPKDPRQTPDGSRMDPRWTPVTLHSFFYWPLQCLFAFLNIAILDCGSGYLALYSILFFDTNVYNESWLTYYYQWLEPGNGSTDYDQITMINETR